MNDRDERYDSEPPSGVDVDETADPSEIKQMSEYDETFEKK